MIEFYKYHGAGNDFIMIDNRDDKKVSNFAIVENINIEI